MNVDITGLSRRFGSVTAVAEVDLQAGPGVFGLLGPNGAGKTSLLRMMATAIPPTSGRLRLLGRDPGSYGPRCEIRRRLGYLPQNPGYYPGFTVAEYVEYFALLKEVPPARIRVAVGMAIDRVMLGGRRKARLRTLSGGMLRRAGIAQAIVNEPQLLLDEPTAGLDPEQRLRFRELVSHPGQDRCVLLSTHQTEDVAALCQRVIVLHQGRVLLDGTPADLAALARGRVWLADSRDLAAKLAWRTPQGRWRNIGDAPASGAELVEPTVEDGYLLLVGHGALDEGVAA